LRQQHETPSAAPREDQRLICRSKLPAKDKIPEMSRGLRVGDVIKVGKTAELECMDTPGHTMSHICVRSHTDTAALFAGSSGQRLCGLEVGSDLLGGVRA
jgi:glyoxylase-like metal-dependent hydrolase (beta-lactamase superfamily II)